jgi:hypothetical protein
MADENVVTEEIGVGTISGGGSTGFDVGQFLLSSSNPVSTTKSDDLSVSSSVVSSSSPVKLAEDVSVVSKISLKDIAQPVASVVDKMVGSNSPTVEELKSVSSVLAGGACADADEIAVQTGLSKETVVYCIEWLVAQGLVAKESTRYCGLSAVKKMCNQLLECRNCFKT